MANCQECGKPMFATQSRCSCGWKNTTNAITKIDVRYGMCEFNDHGSRCGKAGAIALQTGAGGPWYCSNHALGIKGMGKKRNVNFGVMKIGEVMKQLEGGINESQKEAAAERAAIQEEAKP